MRNAPLLLLAIVLALCACRAKHGDTGADTTAPENDVALLPRPEAPGGSVTGMPDRPGPGQVDVPPAPTSVPTPATSIASDGTVVPPSDADALPDDEEENSGPEIAGVPPAAAPEPTTADAVAVVQDYYAAIVAHDYAHAYGFWSDGGRASGQTPQQFADGFANTASIDVQVGAPGRIEGAAGSRFIEVPVSLDALLRDGSTHHYNGSYTLRRAMVDGASPDQRAWRIASANLHETR